MDCIFSTPSLALVGSIKLARPLNSSSCRLWSMDADCLADRANEPQHRKLNGPFGTGCDGPQSRGTIRETSLHDMSEIIEGSQWVDSWVHRTHRCIMC